MLEELEELVQEPVPSKERQSRRLATIVRNPFSPHFPPERLVPPSEYRGFSAEDIALLFGLSEPISARRKIDVLAGRGIATIYHYRDQEGILHYDLRGHARHFLSRRGVYSSYTRAEALTMLERALEAEGVRPQYRQADAEGILRCMVALNPRMVLSGKKYRTGMMNTQFVPAVRRFYDPSAEPLPAFSDQESLEEDQEEGEWESSLKLRKRFLLDDLEFEPEEEAPEDGPLLVVGGKEINEREPDYTPERMPGETKKPVRTSVAPHYSSDYKLVLGRTIAEILGVRHLPSVVAPLATGDSNQFLREHQVQTDLFSPQYRSQSANEIARQIYDRVKDRISFSAFDRMIRMHLDFPNLDPEGVNQLYHRNRAVAILDRAGITTLHFNTLQNVYCALPSGQRKVFFTRIANSRGVSPEKTWGRGYLEKIILDQGKSPTTFTKPMPVYDAIASLAPPWLYAIHTALQLFVSYARQAGKS